MVSKSDLKVSFQVLLIQFKKKNNTFLILLCLGVVTNINLTAGDVQFG